MTLSSIERAANGARVVAWNRLRPVVEADVPRLGDDLVELPDGPLGVAVHGLTYAFPDQPEDPVLSAVDVAVETGEMVAIVGPTGSGKSTLCAAIAGVLDEVADVVEIGGLPLLAIDPISRTDRVAYVFQEAFLLAGTVRENLELGGDFSDEFKQAKVVSAKFFGEQILPTVQGLLPAVQSTADDLYALTPAQL